jgi:hypothetical protein
MTTPNRRKAVLFGLNYESHPTAKLSGCINDVQMMSTFLREKMKFDVDVYTDDKSPHDCSALGIISRLYEVAAQSWRDSLQYVYIHYSGHGAYMNDTNSDEKDKQDECLIPCDVETAGPITDDYINRLFSYFNPITRIICVFDCCHSGTIGDVKYSWTSPITVVTENINCKAKAKIITLSGCMDNQTSADAYNILKDGKFSGALTTCLLLVIKERPTILNNVFLLQDAVRQKLKELKFLQLPKLCSTYDLRKDRVFIQ